MGKRRYKSILSTVKNTKTPKKKDPSFLVMLISGGLILLTGIFIYSNWKIAQKKEELERQIRVMEERISRLQKDKVILQKELQEMEDPYYQEKKLREAGYVKKGEKVILVKGLNSFTPSNTKSSVWSKIKEKLGL